ncbi:hypothetical protein Dimus_007820 [Dionaea muscipula]
MRGHGSHLYVGRGEDGVLGEEPNSGVGDTWRGGRSSAFGSELGETTGSTYGSSSAFGRLLPLLLAAMLGLKWGLGFMALFVCSWGRHAAMLGVDGSSTIGVSSTCRPCSALSMGAHVAELGFLELGDGHEFGLLELGDGAEEKGARPPTLSSAMGGTGGEEEEARPPWP